MLRFLGLTVLLFAMLSFVVGVRRYVAQVTLGKFQCLQFWDSSLNAYWLADIHNKEVILVPKGWPLHIMAFWGANAPVYSSDRRYVAQFLTEIDDHKYVQRLRVEDTQTNEVWILKTTQIIAWQWSPSDSRIVYVRWEEVGNTTSYYIGSVSPDGTEPISRPFPGRLDVSFSIIAALSFAKSSADGAFMAVYVTGENDMGYIELFDANTLKNVTNIDNAAYFSWSPQGHRYAYWRATDTGKQNLLVGTPDHRIDMIFSYDSEALTIVNSIWSPDGRYIVATSLQANKLFNVEQIYFDFYDTQSHEQWLDVPGALTTNQGRGAIYHDDGRWSPDSRAWVFFQQRSGSAEKMSDLIRAEVVGKTLITLATNATGSERFRPPSAVTSPNGNRIALSVWHSNKADVILTNSDGTNLVTLPTEADWIDSLSWSPDGKFVVMGALTGNGALPEQARLIWARADGADQHTLSYKYVSIVGWNGGKNELLFFGRSEATAGLILINLETGTSRVLLNDPQKEDYSSNPSAIAEYWRIYPSPDGKRVVIAYFSSQSTSAKISSSLFLVSWDGKEKQKLRDDLQIIDAFWSPDASAVVIRGMEGLRAKYFDALEVFASDGSIMWQPDTMKFLHPDPQSLVWTTCKSAFEN